MALLPAEFTQAIKAVDKQKSNNKRALVIVYLGGGSDNFNFVSPTTGTNRVNYEAARAETNRIPVDATGNTQLMPGWQMHPQCFKPVLTGGSYAYHSPTTTVVTSNAVAQLTSNLRLDTGDQVYIDFKTVNTGTIATSGVFTATVLTSSTFIIDRSVDVDQTGTADITIRKNTFMRLIDQGKAAVIMNVGPLMEPTSRANVGGAYYGQPASVKLPVQIASHSDQNALWQTGVAQNPQYTTGWAGRAMDLLNPVYNSTLTNGEPTVLYPSSISFSGVGVAFRANDQHAAGMSPTGLTGRTGKILSNVANTGTINSFGSGTQGQLLTNFNNVLYTDTTSSNALIKEYLAAQQRSDVATQVISAVLATTNTFNTVPSDRFSAGESIYSSLKTTTRLIKGMFDTTPSRDLQQNRQIFFMTHGGFDQHDDLIFDQDKRLAPLMSALRQFYDATVDLGVQDNVTLLVYSEFGRTLLQNDDGTDHGWGGHVLVMGGAVQGVNGVGGLPVFGTPPTIGTRSDRWGPDFTNDFRGLLLPSMPTETLYSTLIQWMGIPDGWYDLNGDPTVKGAQNAVNPVEVVLPNMPNFDTAVDGSGNPRLRKITGLLSP
jgi:uncharacterized protein (DUF1501 family)